MRSTTLRRTFCTLTAVWLLACASEPARVAPDDPVPAKTVGSEASLSASLPSPVSAAPAGIAETPAAPLPVGDVYINGRKLEVPDLRELEARQSAAPEPGRYWYDAKSGLWGLWGHAAGGLALADLWPAALAADAAAGATGVIVNGRELTLVELGAIASLLDWPASEPRHYAGRYTLDAKGALYGPANRYLGNLKQAAEKHAPPVAGSTACVWLRMSQPPGALARDVTLDCD